MALRIAANAAAVREKNRDKHRRGRRVQHHLRPEQTQQERGKKSYGGQERLSLGQPISRLQISTDGDRSEHCHLQKTEQKSIRSASFGSYIPGFQFRRRTKASASTPSPYPIHTPVPGASTHDLLCIDYTQGTEQGTGENIPKGQMQ